MTATGFASTPDSKPAQGHRMAGAVQAFLLLRTVSAAAPIGAYVMAAWLFGIIVILLSIGDYYDIALRDFGLLAGALALARLAAPASRTLASSTTANSDAR